MANRRGKSINSGRFYFLGSKITADRNCNHEIKRCFLLGRKAITNLDRLLGLPGGSDYKESAHNVGDLGWEDPLERERLPTPVFLPGEFHGQRTLVGCSPWGHKELDMTE